MLGEFRFNNIHIWPASNCLNHLDFLSGFGYATFDSDPTNFIRRMHTASYSEVMLLITCTILQRILTVLCGG